MRKAEIYQHGKLAGILEELDRSRYRFSYAPGYRGQPISLALPVRETPYEFETFPPVFVGLLPEGLQLEALLRQYKIQEGHVSTTAHRGKGCRGLAYSQGSPMNRCPITYEPLPEGVLYSPRGLKLLHRNSSKLASLEFTAAQQRQEALSRAGKMSIQACS